MPSSRRRVVSPLARFFNPSKSSVVRGGSTSVRRGFETLETRKLLCIDHLGTSEPVVEERPDLVGARSASGDGAEPANIVWTNRGSTTSDTDSFNARFGAAAETARAVVDAVIVAYERMIGSFNYPVAGSAYNLTVNMNGTNSGFGASASMTGSLGGKPRTGSINMGAGSGSTGTGNGWFLDPTPYEHSEFTGSVVNAFSSNAQSSSPAFNKGDFYTVFAAELTHCMGLFGNALAGWSSRTTATTVNDNAEGGNIGQFWIFNGPSITHLLSSNNGGSGGQNFNAAIHSAGPITTTIDGVTYMGAQDQGNAVYEFGRRYMINNAFSLMFKDAYNYSSIDPALYGTAYSVYGETNHALLVRGGTTASNDNITLTREGNILRVSVDVGNDIGGTGALPGAGNLPAFVSEYDISTITAINLTSGDGNDTITIGNDLGLSITIAGGTGTDALIIQGDASDNQIVYNGATITAGTTQITSIGTVESFSFDGGDGVDTLTLTGTASVDTFNIAAAAFSGVRTGNYAAIETLLINTLAGADNVNLNSPAASTLIDVGTIGDTININESLPAFSNSLVATATGVAGTTVNVNDADGVATFDLPASITLQSLTLRTGGSVAGAGDLTLNGALNWTGGTIGGAGSLFIGSAATTSITGDDLKTLSRRTDSDATLSLSGGTLLLSAGLSVTSPALVTAGLTIASGASLDLTDNAAVIDYTGSSPVAAIGAALASGYAAGSWTGLGIRSSTAAATSGRTLGYGEASSVYSTFPATFAGVSVDDTSVLIRYTIPGDANLDRAVNFDDLLITAQFYGTTGRTFAQGNFNYDTAGNVDFDDLLIVAQQYDTSMQFAAKTKATKKTAAIRSLDTI